MHSIAVRLVDILGVRVITGAFAPREHRVWTRQVSKVWNTGLIERASKSKWYLVPDGGSENERRKVSEDDLVNPGDTLIIDESFF